MSILPPGILVLERGWLSSNNILFLEGDEAALVDSGYVSHGEQTVALLRHALDGRRLSRLLNTHSHSDHIGGNAAVKRAFGCAIAIPSGLDAAVADWDEHALMLTSTAQSAERFQHDLVIEAGDVLDLGGMSWQALAAPGHDMHALMFHCPEKRLLISGDALWQNGFGVIFSELLGVPNGMASTRATLEHIARLPVDAVIPGHGAPFVEVDKALETAFGRLAAFEADGERLARHALKVLLSFYLLEKGAMARQALPHFLAHTELCRSIDEHFLGMGADALADWLVRDLEKAGVLRQDKGQILAN
ncbi:MAG: MBL fold metallo-hydrolase [Rhodocyclaceae bacterium]|nr:MBL fold metallo-hydrolase [Rhodocyclaceae bacterium]